MPVDYSALSKQMERAVTPAKESRHGTFLVGHEGCADRKLSSDLATAQQDLDGAKAQVTTLAAQLAEANSTLTAALPPAATGPAPASSSASAGD
ncbi:hypothetical protein CK218_27675 [Mesorhizobium sp. WSM3879]|uniref:hypothetical protein n=1 Tax=Mesorhizobium sp. WSM3879 TaxID=2029406 RepID=UPI000BAE8C4F|nr:hypothetical protein [Mesorhizobium sp. WSM3879]PBB77886.1 hypothetical protein CK218_27675 [Mesorhizobium sp. WSM3879]